MPTPIENPSFRPKPDAPQRRTVVALSHEESDRDDNAMHEYENNWTE